MLREKLVALINWFEAKNRTLPDGLKGRSAYKGLYSSLRYFLYLAVTRNHAASWSVSRPPRQSLHSPKFHWKIALSTALLILMVFLIPQALLFWSALNSPLEHTVGKTVIGLCWDVGWKWASADAFSFKEALKVGGTAVGAAVGFYLLNRRTKASDKQAQLAEEGLDIDRFRKGNEMLADVHPSVKQAGIVSLKQLALSRPKDYGSPVLDAFANFLRKPDAGEMNSTVHKLKDRPDIHLAFSTAMEIWQNKLIRKKHLQVNEYLDMRDVHLHGGTYRALDFQFVKFERTIFERSKFIDANFNSTLFSNARFHDCDFEGSSFYRAQILGGTFRDCKRHMVSWNGATFRHLTIRENEVLSRLTEEFPMIPEDLEDLYVGDEQKMFEEAKAALRATWLKNISLEFKHTWFCLDVNETIFSVYGVDRLECKIVGETCGSLKQFKFVKDVPRKD